MLHSDRAQSKAWPPGTHISFRYLPPISLKALLTKPCVLATCFLGVQGRGDRAPALQEFTGQRRKLPTYSHEETAQCLYDPELNGAPRL